MGAWYPGIKRDRKDQYKKNYGLQLLNLKRKTEAIERKIKEDKK